MKYNTYLSFNLQINDGWPPVSVENIPCEKVGKHFKIGVAPLFVKGLSIDDVIDVKIGTDKLVHTWKHVTKSNNTTIWLLRLNKKDNPTTALMQLKAIGCNSSEMESLGSYSINVPKSVEIKKVDLILSQLDPQSIATAFPSFRHPE